MTSKRKVAPLSVLDKWYAQLKEIHEMSGTLLKGDTLPAAQHKRLYTVCKSTEKAANALADATGRGRVSKYKTKPDKDPAVW